MRYSEYQAAIADFDAALDRAAVAGDQKAINVAFARYRSAETDFLSTVPDTIDEAALRVHEAALRINKDCQEIGAYTDSPEVLLELLNLWADLSDTMEALEAGKFCPGLGAALRQQAEAAAKSLGHDSSAAILLQNVAEGIARPLPAVA